MLIGRVAKLAGVNVETVRYYQRRGLLAEPARYYGTFRRYSIGTVEQILFIKRAQALGFSLDEIEVLIRLDAAADCDPIRDLVTQKTTALRKQIGDLRERLDVLEHLVQLCSSCGSQPGVACPLVGHLSGQNLSALNPAMDSRFT